MFGTKYSKLIFLLLFITELVHAELHGLNQPGYEYCYSKGEVCVDTADRVIEGEVVSRDCWDYEEAYECFSYPQNNDCSDIENAYSDIGYERFETDHRLENGTLPVDWVAIKDVDDSCNIDDQFGCSDWYRVENDLLARTCLTGPKETCNPLECSITQQSCLFFENGICVQEDISYECGGGSFCSTGSGIVVESELGQGLEDVIATNSLLDLVSSEGEINETTGVLTLFNGNDEACTEIPDEGRTALVTTGATATVLAYVYGGIFGVLSAPISAYATAIAEGKMQCCRQDPDDVDVEGSYQNCDDGDRELAAARMTGRAVKAGDDVNTLCACAETGLLVTFPIEGDVVDCKHLCTNPYISPNSVINRDVKVEREQKWCTFDNVFTRVIQEQGRKQIEEILNAPTTPKEDQTVGVDYYESDLGRWAPPVYVADNSIRFWQYGEKCNDPEERFALESDRDLYCPGGPEQMVAICSEPNDGCGELENSPYPYTTDWDIYKLLTNSPETKQTINEYAVLDGVCYEEGNCSWNVRAWPAGIGSRIFKSVDLMWQQKTPFGDGDQVDLQWMYSFGTTTLEIQALTSTWLNTPKPRPTIRVRVLGTQSWDELDLSGISNSSSIEHTVSNGGGEITVSGGCDELLCNYKLTQRVELTLKPWFTYTPKLSKRYCLIRDPISNDCMDDTRIRYGDFYTPHCEGFTLDEFTALDFSRMDLSEYLDTLGEKSKDEILEMIVDE